MYKIKNIESMQKITQGLKSENGSPRRTRTDLFNLWWSTLRWDVQQTVRYALQFLHMLLYKPTIHVNSDQKMSDSFKYVTLTLTSPTPEVKFGSGRSPINRRIVTHTAIAAFITDT